MTAPFAPLRHSYPYRPSADEARLEVITGRYTMAGLFARTMRPRDRLDFQAAIGARAGRIVERVMPVKPTPHGFYDPQGFVASCHYSARRNQLYRELIAHLTETEMLRGRLAPDCGGTGFVEREREVVA